MGFMSMDNLDAAPITRENDQSPFCIPLKSATDETITVCDTSSNRLEQWLKNQFSMKNSDSDKDKISDNKVTEKKENEKEKEGPKESENDMNKLLRAISSFAEMPKGKAVDIKKDILGMLTQAKDEKKTEVDIGTYQSQARQLMEQRKNVEQLFENQEANQASSLEDMIKKTMENRMGEKVTKLAKEIAREKSEAAEHIREEKTEILSSINRRMEKEKQLVAALALEESKMED